MKFIFFVYLLIPIFSSAIIFPWNPAGSTEGICRLPIDSGPCKAKYQKIAYNRSNKICVPFVYGGCRGNANNFVSIEACESICKGK